MSSNNQTISRQRFTAYDIAAIGICTALIFVATAFINLRLPITANGGLIHLGNVPLFLTACRFSPTNAFFSGALGMALFDMMGGWFLWAPFTFFIVGAIGYAFAKIYQAKPGFMGYALAVLAALVIKIIGYYIAEGIIYGNWVAPMTSIPGNCVQILTAGIIAYPILKLLPKTKA